VSSRSEAQDAGASPASEEGNPEVSRVSPCRFDTHAVRYVRVTQTRSAAYTGRHLVEVVPYER
jgi:hypothetical protein